MNCWSTTSRYDVGIVVICDIILGLIIIRSLLRLDHTELHWFVVPDQVAYKRNVAMYGCMHASVSVYAWLCTKIFQHDILQTACGNFVRCTTWVQLGTKMNCLDLEVKAQGHWETKHGLKDTLGILKFMGSESFR